MHSILYEGATVSIGGTNYLVDSVSSIEYAGNDTVTFSILGRGSTYIYGEFVSGSQKTINGSAHFDASNNYTLS
jgi:hypothetical protein